MYIWIAAAFIIVILIWIYYQSKKTEGLMYNYLANTSTNEVDDQYTENLKVPDCLRRCDIEPRCKRLMTDKVTNESNAKCWYKSTNTDKGTTEGGRHLFTKIPDSATATPAVYVTKNYLKMKNGNVLTTLSVPAAECKTWCDTIDTCTSYTTSGLSDCTLHANTLGETQADFATTFFKAPLGICEGDNKFAIKAKTNTDCAAELSKVDALIADAAADAVPKPATYTDYHYGMAIAGDTMQPQYNNSSPEDCRRQCNERAGCVGFVMENGGRTNTECHLKNHLTPFEGNGNWRTQFKAPFGLCTNDPQIMRSDAKGTNCNKQFTFLNEGIEYTGNDIGNFTGGDIYYCEKMCKNNPTCNTISFKKDAPYTVNVDGGNRTITPSSGKCFLKTGRGAEREDPTFYSKSYVDYGKCWNGVTTKNDEAGTNCPPVCSDGKTRKIGDGKNCPVFCTDGKTTKYGDGSNCNATFTPVINGSFPGMPAGQVGEDLDYYADTTKEDCMAVCKSTPDCGGIEIKGKECWIKSKDMIKRRNGDQAGTSYLIAPYGLCDDKLAPKLDKDGNNCKMTMLPVKEKTGVVGSDMFDYTNSSVDDCFNTCKSVAGCKAFNMDTAEGTHCYIKNDIANQQTDSSYDTYEVAPFGLCKDKTAKLDSIGSNCINFTTPVGTPTPTVVPTLAPTRAPTAAPVEEEVDDGIYTTFPTDLTIDCPGKPKVEYCNKPPDRAVNEVINSPAADAEDNWGFSKILRHFFLNQKIMGNEN